MQGKDKKHHIFISAADPSADAHCAGLIHALRQGNQDIEFFGVGGPKMAEAGCGLLKNTVEKSAMTYKALSQVGHYYKLLKRISRFLKNYGADLVIVCDSPSFNFHVAKAAKKAGIKTLFYVAPQLWAWAGWRIHKLRKYCDKLCCILPFEQQWFSQRGVDTTFVGNPLLNDLLTDLSKFKKKYSSFEPQEGFKLALIPGSRAAEIESLWQPMQQIALRLRRKYPGATFVAVAVDTQRQKLLEAAQIPGFECEYLIDAVRDSACNSDFTLVASGSATLEVASAGCPMVVMYQCSRILWHFLGWWLIRPKYFSLVNLLADKDLVPEFMPYFSSIEPIAQAIDKLLQNKNELTRISSDLIDMVEPIAKKKARDEVAKIALEMLR